MNNSSNDFSTLVATPGFPKLDSNTGMFGGAVIKLKRGQWYALVIEHGYLQADSPHITFTNNGDFKLPTNADKLEMVAGGTSTLNIGPKIYYSIVPIKGPNDLSELGETLEIAQIFRAGYVKNVKKVYKKKKEIISHDVEIFKGYKLDDKKKKIFKKKRKKK